MSLRAETLVAADLKRTPLHALHVELGARFAPFAGYEMPMQFRSGILKEHLHTRASAALFDVSHMGQIVVRPRERPADAAHALESLMPMDLLALEKGRQRYGFFTNESGGIVDDLMLANLGDEWLLVVNASCKEADCEHLGRALSERASVELLAERALLALQGPQAGKVLRALAPQIVSMRFLDVRTISLAGVECVVFRSGYTGEDGFEISLPAHAAERLARMLLNDSAVAPGGLGARDSLRIESGLCLYGADIDEGTSPVEAGLAWAIAKTRRARGARAGGFPGAELVLRQLAQGTQRRRIGLHSQERAVIRAGNRLFADAHSHSAVGVVTSGTFGPTVSAPIAMAYIPSALAAPGTTLHAEVRGRRVPVSVSELPFVPTHYKRS